MTYEIQEFPPLSWSVSRMRMLQECPRKYFYNYYAYHNGWLRDADRESKLIYRLKKLQSIDSLFGQFFHENVKDTVRCGKTEIFVPDRFRRKLNRTIKTAYLESKNSMDDWVTHPGWYCMISEVYYEGDIPQGKKNSIIDRVNVTSGNVSNCKSFRELTEEEVEIFELDELKSFEINGLTAYVKIDALYRLANKVIIVDWKTGRESLKDVDQLILYTWYAHKILGLKLTDIEARLEYISQNKLEVYNFGEEELELVDRRLVLDSKRINHYLIDSDKNQPLPKEKFYQVKCGTVCKYCNFREAC